MGTDGYGEKKTSDYASSASHKSHKSQMSHLSSPKITPSPRYGVRVTSSEATSNSAWAAEVETVIPIL